MTGFCDSVCVFPIAEIYIYYAAFACYRTYRKYKFPCQEMDTNGLSSRIYNWETQDSSDIPVSKLGELNMAEEKNTAVLKSNIYLTDI